MNRNSQGNILFLILIAVALFAALSYAITSSSRNSGETISEDKAEMAASTLIQYAINAQQSLLRMTLGQGISWTDVSYGGSNTACTNSNCKFFKPEGGNVSITAPSNVLNPLFPNATVQIRFLQITDVGSELPELVLLVLGIDKQICKAANSILKIPGDSPPSRPSGHVVGGGGVHHLNSGAYSPDILGNVTMDSPQGFYIAYAGEDPDNDFIAGRNSFCMCNGGSTCPNANVNPYGVQYIQVLIPR